MLLTLLCCSVYSTNASHLVGGYMSYEYKGRSGSSYNFRVRLTVYRDCKSDVDYDDFIDVCVFERGTKRLYLSKTMNLVSKRKVDPVGRTDCPELTSACLEQGIYEDNIILPANSQGYDLLWQRCCRNVQVNLPNNSQGDAYMGQSYVAHIPDPRLGNSSPVFADIPVPFICRNDTIEIRNRAVDKDGDSLAYKFVTPYSGAALGDAAPECKNFYTVPPEVIYSSSQYSALTPFGTSGIAKIDPLNGLTTYKAPQTGNYAVAIEVTEYRNGVEISRIRLDLQILVIDCKPNNKPTVSPNLAPNSYKIQAGKLLCFNITANDKDNDNITMQGYGDIFNGTNHKGTKATFAKALGKGTVTSRFCWKTDCDQARTEPYLFTVEAVDDGCPSKFINVNYSITIFPFISNVGINGPRTVCQNEKNITYTATGMQVGSRGIWVVTGGTIVSNPNATSIKVDWGSSTSGTITINEKNSDSCVGNAVTIKVNLTPAPPKPVITGKFDVCLSVSSTYSIIPQSGATLLWKASGGTIMGPNNSNPVTIYWNIKGKGYVTAKQTNTVGCSSPEDTFWVDVHHPTPDSISGPTSVCPNNNGINYFTTPKPGSSFLWFVEGGSQASGGNTSNITINWGGIGTGKVKLVEIDQYGCPSDTVFLVVDKNHALKGQVPIGKITVCEFTSGVIYKVTKVNNSSYNWIVSGGVLVSGQGTEQIVVDWASSTFGSVVVQETSFDPVSKIPCIGAMRALNVYVAPVPKKLTVAGTFKLCQQTGEGAYSVTSSLPGSRFLWSVNGDTNNISGQGNSTITFPYSSFGTFRFNIIETSAYGCVGPLIDTTLIIYPKPTTSPINGPAVICFPDYNGKNYQVSGFANSTFDWTINGGVFLNPDQTNQKTVDWSGQQYNELKVLETSEFGCPGDTIKLLIFADRPSVELNKVTVNPPPGDDRSMHLYFNLINGPKYDNVFSIEKRDAGTTNPFVSVGTAPGNAAFFSENNINTDLRPFEYRVKGYDLCKNELISNTHTNVLVSGSKVGPYSVKLDFTDYLGWTNAVQSYELHRKLVDLGPYGMYGVYSAPTVLNFDNGLDHYTQCYRIKSTETITDSISWSNEICFDFDPSVFVPTAFTLNNDGLNDKFRFKAGGVKKLKFTIFNRWGEILWIADSAEDAWDGTYMGKMVKDGVYVYKLLYFDYKDTRYESAGTITVIR